MLPLQEERIGLDRHRKYSFSWSLIGNIATGRPNLGNSTRLEIYRLMQFTLRDALESSYGSDEADRLFYQAGKLAGIEYYRHILGEVNSFEHFIVQLQSSLKEMSIGIFRVEESDLENGRFVVTMSEDLDCSGLPELDFEICTYDEGFIAGILESYTHQPFRVKEVDCWCTGDRTCRFVAEVIPSL